MITVVVMMCRVLEAMTQPLCHEVIVVRQEMSMQECEFSQPAIAQWKEQSAYRSDKWQIQSFMCQPGDYQVKNAI